MIPLLLLSPDGSRDRAGAVTPVLTGTITTVPGQYGTAWGMVNGEIAIPQASRIAPDRGTLAVRCRIDTVGDVAVVGTYGAASAEWMGVQATSAPGVRGRWRHGSDVQVATNAVPITLSQWITIIYTWRDTTIRLMTGGLSESAARTAPFAAFSTGDLRLTAGGTFGLTGAIESVLVYARDVTDQEVATLREPRPWTWDILTPKLGGLLRLGMGLGLAVSSVAAPAALGIARELGGLS